MPLATLKIRGASQFREEVFPRSARKASRKARRLGYYYKAVDPQLHLDDIFAIRSSARERQGRPMPAYYFEPVSRVLDLDGYCDRHSSAFYGIFKDKTLVAYSTVLFFGELAQLDNILGHKAHLADGIMDLLIEEASLAIAETRPWVRGLNYLYATGWTGLSQFKANTGFLPQFTTFTSAPPAIARRIEEQLSKDAARCEGAAAVKAGTEEKECAQPRVQPPLARLPQIFGGLRRQPDDWSEPSGIHSVLRALELSDQKRVLCVGAGGNLAYSALSALVDKGFSPLVVEWRGPDLIANVEKVLGNHCILIPRVWKDITFANPFCLVIFDLYYISFMNILMRDFRAASKLVRLGGFLVVKFFYDIDSGMSPEDRQSLGPLYIRRFKSAQPALVDIADAFRGSAFHVHGLIDRANEQAATKNLGWLVLRKVRET